MNTQNFPKKKFFLKSWALKNLLFRLTVIWEWFFFLSMIYQTPLVQENTDFYI